MSTEPDKSSLLAPLADAYEPTAADADRVFARIQASLASPPAASAASPGASSPAAPPGAATGARAGKGLLAAGLSCVLLAVVGGVVAQQGRSHRADHVSAAAPDARNVPTQGTPASPQGTAAPYEPANAPVAPSTPAIPSISVDSLPTANANANAAANASASAARVASPPTNVAARATAKNDEGPPPGDTLEQEARLLAEARRAVQRGEATQALALLDEHARSYPRGWLASDRAAEHIVVLCSMGRRDEAVREAKVFLEGRPKGPLTRRVAMSCAGEP